MTGQWIPTGEPLPPCYEDVLCWTCGNWPVVARRVGPPDWRWFWGSGYGEKRCVSHWMKVTPPEGSE